jgi:hypothetical protein
MHTYVQKSYQFSKPEIKVRANMPTGEKEIRAQALHELIIF